MSSRIIKKNLIFRITSYFLILPFIPALRPIIGRHNLSELIIFITGFLLTLFLIIYSNNKPYIRVSDKNLFIYLLYRHKPEIHNFSAIEEVRIKSPRRLELRTVGFDPLDIRLGKKELEKLSTVLQNEGVTLNKVYRNS